MKFIKGFRIVALNKKTAGLIKKMFDEAPVKHKAEWESINKRFKIGLADDCIGWEFIVRDEVISAMIKDRNIHAKNTLAVVNIMKQMKQNLKGERLKNKVDFIIEELRSEVI